MAKEKPADPDREARKAEKRAKKEAKRSDTDGVHKSKKDSKSKDKIIHDDAQQIQRNSQLLQVVEDTAPSSVLVQEDEDSRVIINLTRPVGALVPFARPLAEEKTAKKVFKTVKKAHKHNTLKRGVKECVKALRKSPIPGPSSTATPSFVCVLAGDISPMDVISHLPVLCEDHGVPYIFVESRTELGAAGATQRPTSVVLISQELGKQKKKRDKKGEEGNGKRSMRIF